MPRELCVGNGNFQVNFDNDMNFRDMFSPFVGLENHVSGRFCRFGVWVDGRFSWINASWDKRFRYKKDSLVACMHEESEKKTVSRTMKLKKTEKGVCKLCGN